VAHMRSPKSMTPPARMSTVLTWPTTLKVTPLVAPIMRNMDRLTSRPSAALPAIAAAAASVISALARAYSGLCAGSSKPRHVQCDIALAIARPRLERHNGRMMRRSASYAT